MTNLLEDLGRIDLLERRKKRGMHLFERGGRSHRDETYHVSISNKSGFEIG